MENLRFLLWFFFKAPVQLVLLILKKGVRLFRVSKPLITQARKLSRPALSGLPLKPVVVESDPAAPSGAIMKPVAVVASAPMQMLQSGEFEVADRIISIRLVPPVGVLNMRIYQESKLIKRDLIIHEPRLRAIMRGRRFTFPDVPFDPKVDMDDVKDETVQLAEKLINEVGNARVKAHKPGKDELKGRNKKLQPDQAATPVGKPEPMPAPPAPQVLRQAPGPAPKAAVADQKPTQGRVFAPQPTVGITYVGRLTQAGAHKVTPKGRDAYEVFQATIEMDNGAVLPLRGAELERELEAAGCRIGERVAITPMGKVPVALSSGGEGSKNLYKVDNLAVTQ